tara:strand:+ start:62683 stop:63333 length:651 start_codon:yes stop_codon:yes gene_type:complete
MKIYRIAQEFEEKYLEWKCPKTGIAVRAAFVDVDLAGDGYELYCNDGSFVDTFDNFWHARNWAKKHLNQECNMSAKDGKRLAKANSIKKLSSKDDYELEDLRNKKREPGKYHPVYTDFGHGSASTGQYENCSGVDLWAITEKGIETRRTEDVDKDFIHAGWLTDKQDQGWKGRYDRDYGILTIITPERFSSRDVPNAILRMLTSRFKDVKEVKVFG